MTHLLSRFGEPVNEIVRRLETAKISKTQKGKLPGKRSFFTFVTIFCSLIRCITTLLKKLFVHNLTHPIVSYYEPSSQSDEWQ